MFFLIFDSCTSKGSSCLGIRFNIIMPYAVLVDLLIIAPRETRYANCGACGEPK